MSAEFLLAPIRERIPRPLFRAASPAYHFLLAFFAALAYGFPGRGLTVIGVTGTDGKTTVVHLLHEMLVAAGHRTGSLSSLRFKINEREEANLLKMTMPGRFRLERFLADCRKARCRFVIIEVTSQGIAQSRHRFILFRSAVLTNVSPEHIEAHGGFAAYRAAKMKLFQRLSPDGPAVLNRDDPSSELFAERTRGQVVWYSPESIEIRNVGHPVRVETVSAKGIRLLVDGVLLETRLGGAFNVANILAAAAAAMAHGVSLSAIADALARLPGLPGRLEYVFHEPFRVVVDYANTPRAYEAVYQALTSGNSASQIANSRLICVFGAPGGGRDKWKRPELGTIAARYCREVILTSDDADDEDPATIAADILGGIESTMRAIARIVLDRREAIREALKMARSGDTVIITGMGAQPWLVLKGGKIPWDDRVVAREELAALAARQ